MGTEAKKEKRRRNLLKIICRGDIGSILLYLLPNFLNILV
jgi:hypothetical protein